MAKETIELDLNIDQAVRNLDTLQNYIREKGFTIGQGIGNSLAGQFGAGGTTAAAAGIQAFQRGAGVAGIAGGVIGGLGGPVAAVQAVDRFANEVINSLPYGASTGAKLQRTAQDSVEKYTIGPKVVDDLLGLDLFGKQRNQVKDRAFASTLDYYGPLVASGYNASDEELRQFSAIQQYKNQRVQDLTRRLAGITYSFGINMDGFSLGGGITGRGR